MSTIDGLTIEERGGPERCDGGTCYAGCTHNESAWAAKLAAAEAVARECKAQYHARRDALIAAEAWCERYEEALKSIAANTCCDRCQEAALVARAALTPPPEAEKRGGGVSEIKVGSTRPTVAEARSEAETMFRADWQAEGGTLFQENQRLRHALWTFYRATMPAAPLAAEGKP